MIIIWRTRRKLRRGMIGCLIYAYTRKFWWNCCPKLELSWIEFSTNFWWGKIVVLAVMKSTGFWRSWKTTSLEICQKVIQFCKFEGNFINLKVNFKAQTSRIEKFFTTHKILCVGAQWLVRTSHFNSWFRTLGSVTHPVWLEFDFPGWELTWSPAGDHAT